MTVDIKAVVDEYLTRVNDQDYNIAEDINALQDALYTLAYASINQANFANVQTLSGNLALTNDDPVIQILATGASHRDVTLPAVADTNHAYLVYNDGGGAYNLVIKKSGGTILKTVGAGYAAFVVPTSADWIVVEHQAKLDLPSSSELTIAAGVVTPTQNWHTIDTEADAASDDLDTIVAGGFDILFFRPENDARTVVVKHNTGNILCATGTDMTLDNQRNLVIAIYDTTLAKWIAIALPAGSTTAVGLWEGATSAETTSGSDAGRVVTPAGLAGSDFGIVAFAVEIFAAGTALTTGDGKKYIPIPDKIAGFNVIRAHVTLFAKSTSGLPNFQVARGRKASATTAHAFVDMFSTAITVDANEFDSRDAATPPVIDASNDDLAAGDILRIDCDAAGTGATGAWMTFECQKQ